MPRSPSPVRAAFPVLLAALALGGCTHRRAVLVAAPPAPPVLVAAPPLVERAPINAGLSPAATVWHLRAALNVAALACRAPGEATMARQYNALLGAHRASLAAAQASLAAEYRAGGGDWRGRYDGAMTRLYNFFATTQAHGTFCAAAARVMADARMLAPGRLTGFAAERLPLLDAAFGPSAAPAPPVIALAAAPTPVRRTRRPRLELDLSTLPPD